MNPPSNSTYQGNQNTAITIIAKRIRARLQENPPLKPRPKKTPSTAIAPPMLDLVAIPSRVRSRNRSCGYLSFIGPACALIYSMRALAVVSVVLHAVRRSYLRTTPTKLVAATHPACRGTTTDPPSSPGRQRDTCRQRAGASGAVPVNVSVPPTRSRRTCRRH